MNQVGIFTNHDYSNIQRLNVLLPERQRTVIEVRTENSDSPDPPGEGIQSVQEEYTSYCNLNCLGDGERAKIIGILLQVCPTFE